MTTTLRHTKKWFFFLRGRQHLVGESPWATFSTPPRIDSPCTLALVGDLGQTGNSTKTMNHILTATQNPNEPVSTVLMAGDLSYSDGDPKRWEQWLEVMVGVDVFMSQLWFLVVVVLFSCVLFLFHVVTLGFKYTTSPHCGSSPTLVCWLTLSHYFSYFYYNFGRLLL